MNLIWDFSYIFTVLINKDWNSQFKFLIKKLIKKIVNQLRQLPKLHKNKLYYFGLVRINLTLRA